MSNFCLPVLIAGYGIMKGSGYGFIADVVPGTIGAPMGAFLAIRFFHFKATSLIGELLVALVSGTLVVVIFRLITGKRV